MAQPEDNAIENVCRNIMWYARTHDKIDDLRIEMQGSFGAMRDGVYNPTVRKLVRIATALDIDLTEISILLESEVPETEYQRGYREGAESVRDKVKAALV
ncbi:hypothetical protein [Enterococcus nangangensis]|uniref:hypothetical protein n=1 Tax=Enterococcus nangangensis TaxID=2559926 RepID=UPI0010F4B2E1|nr:hypothetical protein [Enterococcus nangangensis]